MVKESDSLPPFHASSPSSSLYSNNLPWMSSLGGNLSPTKVPATSTAAAAAAVAASSPHGIHRSQIMDWQIPPRFISNQNSSSNVVPWLPDAAGQALQEQRQKQQELLVRTPIAAASATHLNRPVQSFLRQSQAKHKVPTSTPTHLTPQPTATRMAPTHLLDQQQQQPAVVASRTAAAVRPPGNNQQSSSDSCWMGLLDQHASNDAPLAATRYAWASPSTTSIPRHVSHEIEATEAAAASAARTTAAPNEKEDLSELPKLRSRMRGYVHEIIVQQHREETKSSNRSTPKAAAYLQAVAKDWELVQKETDPLQFVRRCDYDLWAGAQRLCLYWTERLALFGPERAFLPMVQTGTGALTNQDLYTLQAGFPCLLPPPIAPLPSEDEEPEAGTSKSPSCLLLDRRKWIPSQWSSTENKLRCLFYLMHILAQEQEAQTKGVLVLAAVMTPRFPELNLQWMHRAAYFGAKVFPVKAHLHLLNFVPHSKATNHNNPQSSSSSLVEQAMECTVSIVRRYALPNYPIHTHTQRGGGGGGGPSSGTSQTSKSSLSSKNTIVQDLLELGLKMEGIPMAYGGEWRFDEFFQWCRERREWEQETFQDRLLSPDASSNEKRTDNAEDRSPFHALGNGLDLSWYAAAGGQHKRRRGNDGQPIPGSNSKPSATKQDKQVKSRIADMLHSRRKRERRQKEVQHLKIESTKLTQEHTALKAQQERLQQFLEAAQAIVEQLEDGKTDIE